MNRMRTIQRWGDLRPVSQGNCPKPKNTGSLEGVKDLRLPTIKDQILPVPEQTLVFPRADGENQPGSDLG